MGGDILSFVVIDAAGNQSPAVAMAVPAPLTLTSIAVTPSSFTLNRSHTSQQLVVTGTFSDGSQQTITSGLTFASSAPTIAGATAAASCCRDRTAPRRSRWASLRLASPP